MKQLLFINGSPRKNASTAALCGAIAEGIEPSKAEIRIHHANDLTIHGCQSCFRCTKENLCVQQDDMREIYSRLLEADGVVFATPVYMWQMTGQLKLILDRLFAVFRAGFAGENLFHGKKALIAVTQGQADTNMFRPYFEHVTNSLKFLGFDDCRILIAGSTHAPGELLCQKDRISEAQRLGAWLCE